MKRIVETKDLLKRYGAIVAHVLLTAFAVKGSETTFTVATYNVKVADKADGETLSWGNRLPRLVTVMRAGKFDLVGLQEVTQRMEADLSAALPEYAFVDGPKKDGPVPIAYRPELFEQLDAGRFSMSEKPDDFKFVSWGASGVRVCQWALFRVRADGSRVRVFNMHPDWKSCKARAKGMEMSLERIQAARAAGERVVLLGDMNDMQNFKYPEEKNDPQYPYGMSIRLAREVLKDSYDLTKTPHVGPYLTAQWFLPKESERLDYVFLSDGFEVLAHRTHDDRPDGGFPSDHDAVSARLKVVPFPSSGFEVYFMRHGQTDWNVSKRLQGSTAHTRLTDKGVRMAEASADGFRTRGIRFDRVYTSPYDRASNTAAIVVRETDLVPVADARLREMCFGKYEGMIFGKDSWPDDNLRRLFEDPEFYVPTGDGAESFAAVQARLRDFLEHELKPLDGKVTRVLCVAHSLVLRSLVRELTKTSESMAVGRPLQPNCCVHILKYADGKFSLVETGRIFYNPSKF